MENTSPQNSSIPASPPSPSLNQSHFLPSSSRLPNNSFFERIKQIFMRRKKIIFLAGLLIIVNIIIAVLIYLFFSKNTAKIEGKIGLNGYVPEGATIAIAKKGLEDKQFYIVTQGIVAKDGASWVWKNAEKGKGYEIRAYLQQNGDNIGESDSLFVAAPAANEVLNINSQNKPSQKETVIISGTIDLNGVVPQDSKLAIAVKKNSETDFTTIISGMRAKDMAQWSYNNAQSGESYEIKALLTKKDQTIAESQVLKVVAPAANEVLRIDTGGTYQHFGAFISPTVQVPTATVAPVVLTATPIPTVVSSFTPTLVPNAIISGEVDLNGNIPDNGIITVTARKSGESNFNIVNDGIAAKDKATWSWSGANSGAIYQMIAYLKINGANLAQSQTITVTAPAANEIFVINVLNNLQQPQYSPGIQCNQTNSQNLWNVNISYHSMDGANLYWLKVGDINQDNRYIDAIIPPNNQTLPTTYSFTTDYFFSQGTTYFVKYAYSTCSNCTDIFYFSPWSQITQFSCNPPQPTATPTVTLTPKPTTPPTATYTPTPTFTPLPTPTDTPIPTLTEKPIPTNLPQGN